jgi:hypothetical protein
MQNGTDAARLLGIILRPLDCHAMLTSGPLVLPGTEAGLRLNASAPAVWQFVSDSQRNAFGQPRGYAVSFTGQPRSSLVGNSHLSDLS